MNSGTCAWAILNVPVTVNHPGVFILSVLNSWWDQVKKSAFIFHSHQHHKTRSWWSLNTAKRQYTVTFAVATGNQVPCSPGLCFSLPAVKRLWHNIVFSSIFFPIAASCGNEHDAFGAAASEEPDNPASIRQDSFDCLSVDKQRQTMWLKKKQKKPTLQSDGETELWDNTWKLWHRGNRRWNKSERGR